MMGDETDRTGIKLVLRLFLAALGIGILVWLICQLQTGAIRWNVSDYISNETIEQYVASTLTAKLIATALLGLLSLGLITYGLFPRVLLYPMVMLGWVAILAVLGLLLKPFSTRVGP